MATKFCLCNNPSCHRFHDQTYCCITDDRDYLFVSMAYGKTFWEACSKHFTILFGDANDTEMKHFSFKMKFE